jgi:hypothetical protein
MAMLLLCSSGLVAAADQPNDADALYATLAATLTPGTDRPAPRLAQVSIDASGDATVLFGIQNQSDDPNQIRDGALADAFVIFKTVYTSASAPRISSVTVLGSFPFRGTKGSSVRDSPVLRAVLSAPRAASINWDDLDASGLQGMLDTLWIQSAFATAVGPDQTSATSATERPSDSIAARDLELAHEELPVALAHVQEALLALRSDDVQISRSQLKQFFDVWDEVDDPIQRLRPQAYADFDDQLADAESALLRSHPEDVVRSDAALARMQLQLQELINDLNS